jgi:hypothetical protein
LTVESSTDGRGNVPVTATERQTSRSDSTLGEEDGGVAPDALVTVVCVRPAVSVIVERKATDAKDPLVGDDQSHPAGHEHIDMRTDGEQALDKHRNAVRDVLAIVEQQQPMSPIEADGQQILHCSAGRFVDPEGSGDRGGYKRRIGDRYQVDIPNSTRKAINNISGDGDGQASLAHTTGPDRRDHSRFGQRCRQTRPFVFSSDERCQRNRQPTGTRHVGSASGAGRVQDRKTNE